MADTQKIAAAQGNGNSTGVAISRPAHIHESHLRTLFVGGTFDSATVKYQLSLDDTTYFDVTDADAITAAEVINVEHRALFHRINVNGGGGSVAIDAWVI